MADDGLIRHRMCFALLHAKEAGYTSGEETHDQALDDLASMWGLLESASAKSERLRGLAEAVRDNARAGWPNGAIVIGNYANESGVVNDDPITVLLALSFSQLASGGSFEPAASFVESALEGPLDPTPEQERVCAAIMWLTNYRDFRSDIDRTPQLPFGGVGADTPEQEELIDRGFDKLLGFARKAGFRGDGHFDEDASLAATVLSDSFHDHLVIAGRHLPAAAQLADVMYAQAEDFSERCAELTRLVMTSGLYHADPVLGSIAAAVFSMNARSCADSFLCMAWLVNAIKLDTGAKDYLPADEYLETYISERVIMSALAWYVNWDGFRARLAQRA